MGTQLAAVATSASLQRPSGSVAEESVESRGDDLRVEPGASSVGEGPRYRSWIMLFARRKRLQELAEAEANGRSFWTPDLDERTRYRLLHAVKDLTKDTGSGFDQKSLLDLARDDVLSDEGLASLTGKFDAAEDVANCIINGDEDIVFSLLEGVLRYAKLTTETDDHGSLARGYSDISRDDQKAWSQRLPGFRNTVRMVLREHRVSFDLVDDRFIPFESREMHESVVVPALTLLGGRGGFEAAESAYRDAIEEIQAGKPADAITDAGTALQETLRALGCRGNSLGPQLKDARSKGLLGPHDSPMTDALRKIAEWVSADRSETGDSHNAASARIEDAWLIVHVVGALILRLAENTPRPSPGT